MYPKYDYDYTYTYYSSIGFKDQVDALEKAAAKARADFSKVAGKGAADANKKLNKARRLANRALDFDDDEDNSVDYDLLLEAVGTTEKVISIRAKHSQNYHVPAGSLFVWKARVKKNDIGFSIFEVNDGENIEIQENRKYSSDVTIQGQLPATSNDRVISLVFDNSYSNLAVKRVAYWIACGENVSLADDAIGAARSIEVAAAEEGPPE